MMDTDLSEVIKSKQSLDIKHIMWFLYQLVKGVKFIHNSNIIHRDLVSNSYHKLITIIYIYIIY